jgi:hypothetical protein
MRVIFLESSCDASNFHRNLLAMLVTFIETVRNRGVEDVVEVLLPLHFFLTSGSGLSSSLLFFFIYLPNLIAAGVLVCFMNNNRV